MEKITVRLNYCLADNEIRLANIDKLKLIIYLCEMKLEKGIDLPFKEVTVIGTDYISDDYTLTKSLGQVVKQSRKIGVVFTLWEKWEQKESDFSKCCLLNRVDYKERQYEIKRFLFYYIRVNACFGVSRAFD
jgi:hypothetical protein